MDDGKYVSPDLAGCSPALSSGYYDPKSKAGYDTAIVIEVVHYDGAPGFTAFMHELIKRLEDNSQKHHYSVMPEWSKGFASTDCGDWRDNEVLRRTKHRLPRWDEARRALAHYDPKNIFATPFTEGILSTSFP